MSLPWRFRGGVLVAVVLAAAVPAEARSSELIARNATGVRLQADAQGRGADLVPLGGPVATAPRVGGDRRPAAEPDPAAGGVQAPVRRIDRPERLRRLQGPAARLEGRRVHDTERRALGAAGVAADAPELRRRADRDRAAWELRLSHWSGPLPVLELWTDWSYRRFHHLYGRLTYRAGGVFGFRSTRFGVPLDTYGRNVFVDTFGSAYGSGWQRENSFLTHKPTGGFCYGFYPHGPHPVGAGTKYRATVIGPGVTPDVTWEGRAPGAFDAAARCHGERRPARAAWRRSALQDQLGAREQQYLVLAIVLAQWLLAEQSERASS